MSSPRLLVTGAGGFCGEHAMAYFAQAGYEAVASVRHSGAAAGSMGQLADQPATAAIACDWTDLADAKRAIQAAQPDYVVHLAGLNAADRSWHDPAGYLMANVMGTVHLLEAVRALGKPCRVLIAGSMLRFELPAGDQPPEPAHPYSVSKTMQVLLAQCWPVLYGMDVIIAEPSNLIGPGRSRGLCMLLAKYAAQAEAIAAAAPSGHGVAGQPVSPAREEAAGAADTDRKPPLIQPFRLSSRTEQRDYLDVRDAMAAYDLLLQHGAPGSVYPVASGRFVTLEQLASQFMALAACPLHFDIGNSTSPSPAPTDTSRIRSLGWEPRFTLKQSLQDTLEDARARLIQKGEPERQ
ncbi:NAD-dependent epimerase/dehydratase family protein [Paenibacillus sp. MMS18-CY102]|uniref:NAD-dependent epimerase/dehydratase family protein n=1 Tax=Paenibacillus sp. MMS18-CY102 TaxID=2682849 RepID=UPI00136579DD|nr:NAD-dependent epimerase/dehydratase family protein [Paenibacillus sp. MMS18-CY102]MWC28644.1 NAD-dependent epimerase/dehydratase family protein [Paenibacillus sp. MMS18-CY102]